MKLSPTLASITSLLLSFGLLCLGHGLQNTLIGVRASLESYSDITIGLMMSIYFAGFILGTRLSAHSITTVGQIRTFAAAAAVISAISLLHLLFLHPVIWMALRFFYGLCIASTYMVIESWLNMLCNSRNRGGILSIYMTINFVSLSASQLFFNISDGSSYILFAVVSLFASLSVVPLLLSKTKQPQELESEPLPIKHLFKISPLALVGTFCIGITTGGFWGLVAPTFIKFGFSAGDVAGFISLSFLGGLLFQWPIGWLSDRINRRIVITGCAGGAALITVAIIMQIQHIDQLTFLFAINAVLFGALYHPLYSLFIALANDFLKEGLFVKASVGLLSVHGAGCVCGPLLGALFLTLVPGTGLFMLMLLVFIITGSFSLYQFYRGRTLPQHDGINYVGLPKTGSAIYTLDPRRKS